MRVDVECLVPVPPAEVPADPAPQYPDPGSDIPGQPGYVVGVCGHRVAQSEWNAGFRDCERCAVERRSRAIDSDEFDDTVAPVPEPSPLNHGDANKIPWDVAEACTEEQPCKVCKGHLRDLGYGEYDSWEEVHAAVHGTAEVPTDLALKGGE
jgi:hypothetical protein